MAHIIGTFLKYKIIKLNWMVQLLSWRRSKGRTPRWFTEIENKLIKDKNIREVFSSYDINKDIYDKYRNKRMIENNWGHLEMEFSGEYNERDKVGIYEIFTDAASKDGKME
ncbi:hypothetical protein RhiirA5_433377 [Rhizophagus irregularis]|uniref:Uncharacterized protein n=1 Tax=Rhizophagus irregularis TaxID=588596 RepID=A0A2N0NRW8_9GLOM|nr:hypothetical protein RhiirA5_433377 [Rhizophagus irregularis]